VSRTGSYRSYDDCEPKKIFGSTIDENFDVGIDTRTPVDDKDYQVPFRFTGKLDKLTFNWGRRSSRATISRSSSTRAQQRTTDPCSVLRASIAQMLVGHRHVHTVGVGMSAIGTKQTYGPVAMKVRQ
jgi:hypothetical protein